MKSKNLPLKKDINHSILATMIFTLAVFVLGLFVKKIPYAQAFLMIAAALLILFLNRKSLPAKWIFPKGGKMPVAEFLVALGIIGAFQAAVNVSGSYSVFSLENLMYLGVVTPLTEELVFRGVILNRLKGHGAFFAIIASSVLFGLYHMNPVQLVTAGILGIMLAYIALNYSIVYSITLHFVNNFFFVLLLAHLSETIALPNLVRYVGILFLASGIIGAIICKPWKKVAAFFRENRTKSEEGCYTAFFLHPFFLLIIVLVIAFSAFLFYSLMPSARV